MVRGLHQTVFYWRLSELPVSFCTTVSTCMRFCRMWSTIQVSVTFNFCQISDYKLLLCLEKGLHLSHSFWWNSFTNFTDVFQYGLCFSDPAKSQLKAKSEFSRHSEFLFEFCILLKIYISALSIRVLDWFILTLLCYLV